MQDTSLYEQLLGLERPWSVRDVRMNREVQEIEVEVVCEDTLWGCPKCQQRAHLHDYERRRWRHLDSCQYKTFVVCDVPGSSVPTTGRCK